MATAGGRRPGRVVTVMPPVQWRGHEGAAPMFAPASEGVPEALAQPLPQALA
jgi:hypothetical protein